MKKNVSRREFLEQGLAGSAGALAAFPVLAPGAGAEPGASPSEVPGVCLTICNHWSYIGIGWQLGIESCVLSVTDAMEMADRPPHAKTCVNLDARAYEFMAEKFPEVTERLKKYLADGKIELIGGTYGQPMGSTISGESNIRQIVIGREVIRKVLGYSMTTFLEEEEFTHPQVPQMAAQAGFRYASLAQLDTWGRAGCPRQDLNVVLWKGLDGTVIRSVPKNALFGYSPDLKKLAASPEFQKLARLGKPLVFAWEEFGWESHEHPAYLTAPARYRTLAQVEFVTLKEYLDKYGFQGKETNFLPLDSWDKSLTWGLGGDQVRILDRKVDGLLLAAELFDACAACQGRPSQAEALDKAWRDLLASQSHDVGLCEYSRWQGDRMAPLDRIEDYHNFTWGTIGYNHLDAAQKQAQPILDGALRFLAAKRGQGTFPPALVGVFNPHGWCRTDLATTGRIFPVPPGSRNVTVQDRSGRVIPSQVVKEEKDSKGNLRVVEVAFLAREVPSAGYDTYNLDFTSPTVTASETSLRVNEGKLVMENEYVRLRLDPLTGGLASLVEKKSGREMLSPTRSSFPHFTGRPNPNLSTRPNPPAFYDSSKSRAQIDWLAKGPLWATVRARHAWPYCQFETRITLAAGRPYPEILSRLLVLLPPHSDVRPADIKEGYWFSMLPGFAVEHIIRDFPFGVDETKKATFPALTFVDLLGKDQGLLVLHAGTQFFRREPSGAASNLVMSEWESHFSREYGWPLYAEYRHGLLPHAGPLTNAERLRAAAGFSQPLACVVGPAGSGSLPPSQSYLSLSPGGVQLSAFRKRPDGGYELRIVETEGKREKVTITLNLPVTKAAETDLLGNKLADVQLQKGQLATALEPWKIRTFRLD
jgi:alpha-mannosidase